jgi:hypothetical protein
MWAGLAGAVFIMCIMLNSFGLAWASTAAKIWLMLAGMARFWLRGEMGSLIVIRINLLMVFGGYFLY